MNGSGRTWYQLIRSGDVLEEYTGTSNVTWRYPKRKYHLHLGWYRQARRQLTVIVDGADYSYQKAHDELGERIGTGTLEEMLEMQKLYAQML